MKKALKILGFMAMFLIWAALSIWSLDHGLVAQLFVASPAIIWFVVKPLLEWGEKVERDRAAELDLLRRIEKHLQNLASR